MSNFRIDTSGTPPPASAETLTGDSGGAVGPDGSNNINVLTASDSNLTFTGDSGTNTLTLSVTNQLVGTATTVGATQETLWTFDLGASPRTYLFSVSVVGYESSLPGLVSLRTTTTVATNGSTAFSEDPLEVTKSTSNSLEAATLNRGFAPNNYNLSVVGVAGFTIVWKAVATYVRNT